MDAGPTAEATAATAAEPWQFGFLVAAGRIGARAADANARRRGSQRRRPVAVHRRRRLSLRLSSQGRVAGGALDRSGLQFGPTTRPACGGNSAFYDWQDAGPLRPDWPAVRVYRTADGFRRQARRRRSGSEGGPACRRRDSKSTPAIRAAGRSACWTTCGWTPAIRPANRAKRVLDLPLFRGRSGRSRAARVSRQLEATRARPADRAAEQAGGLRPAIRPAHRPGAIGRRMPSSSKTAVRLRQAASRSEMAQGTYWYDAAGHALLRLPDARRRAVDLAMGRRAERSVPRLVRGLYTVGGNAYGHQKQYCWGNGLCVVADVFDDMSMGFSSGQQHQRRARRPWSAIAPSAGAAATMGMGGEISGFERHTADRIKRPELHVDHCIFDVSNSSCSTATTTPPRTSPSPTITSGRTAIFCRRWRSMRGRGGTSTPSTTSCRTASSPAAAASTWKISETLHRPQQHLRRREGVGVTFRGSDKGHVLNNVMLPRRRPLVPAASPSGPTPPGHGASLLRRQLPDGRSRAGALALARQPGPRTAASTWASAGCRWPINPKSTTARTGTIRSPLLIDGPGFASYRAVGGVAEMARGCYFHDRLRGGSISARPTAVRRDRRPCRLAAHPQNGDSPPRFGLHADRGAAGAALAPLQPLSKTELEIDSSRRRPARRSRCGIGTSAASRSSGSRLRPRDAHDWPAAAALQRAAGRPTAVHLSGGPAAAAGAA